MQNKEYRTIDKADWLRGPWDNEPDKLQWTDEKTGYPCLAKRHPTMGFLCGYVGVPPGHRLYQDDTRFTEELNAHGGITFTGACEKPKDPAHGICHQVERGESDDVWWLGFDCGHFMDYFGFTHPEMYKRFPPMGEYRTVEYVKAQCADLARQLYKMRRPVRHRKLWLNRKRLSEREFTQTVLAQHAAFVSDAEKARAL